MASQQAPHHDRGFREVVVGKCYVQTCAERFGDGARDIIRQRERDHLMDVEALSQGIPTGQIITGEDQDEAAGAQEPPLEKKIPKMQYYRNSLTALSQIYNLYFAAYENRIFVYRPSNVPKQSLPREPNLILATKPDKVAMHVSGDLDEHFHHQANHIITGFMGREEVLVSAYDDGSVFAYYTRHIADYVERNSRGCRTPGLVPTYFFSENVGKSAWGLAIHQKSRLIAVSSNRFEVTVFAFGLSRLSKAMDRRPKPIDYCEESVLKRKRNWRIVIPLGAGGHNIPNISLCDDDEGFAEKVVAIDINGTVWVLDIWKSGTAALKIPHRANVSRNFHLHGPLGWNVIVLPFASFLPARSATDLLGLEESDIMNARPPHAGRWIEVQKGLAGVRNHPGEVSAQHIPEPETFAGFEQQHEDGPWVFAPHQPMGLLATLLGGGMPPNAEEPVAENVILATVNMQIASLGDESSEGEHELILGTEDESSGSPEEMDEEGEEDDDSSVELLGLFPTGQNTVIPEGDDFAFIEEAVHHAQSYMGAGETMMQVLPPDGACSFLKNLSKGDDMGKFQASWLDMVYYPHSSKTFVSPTSVVGRLQFHRRPRYTNDNTTGQDTEVIQEISNRCCILRTYEKDIEMRSINPYDRDTAVFCRDPISWNHPPHPVMRHAERLNMIAHVPELSLVVIGSAIGRVILLTPTRSPCTLKGNEFALKHGYRIDWVLPTLSEEKAGLRPTRALYGIAVGPVQEGGARGCLLRRGGVAVPSPASRRYRLMLHYRDHRILTYEIGRDEKNEHILVF